jgi:GT2 family glycosyltransferase
MTYFSLVVYDSPPGDLRRLIKSLLKISTPYKLWVINNSQKINYKPLFDDIPCLQYVQNKKNEGFGKAHNITLAAAKAHGVKYVFVINPDIYFYEDISVPILNFMDKHKDVGMLMPSILNTDGTKQHLPKLLPNPALVLLRKLNLRHSKSVSVIDNYELRHAPKETIFETPNISGCCTIIRTEILGETGYYDPRFFLYFEDWDLSRRVFKRHKTILYPFVNIFHSRSSQKKASLKKLMYHFISYLKYFNKWGWLDEEERKSVNDRIFKGLKNGLYHLNKVV